jgi:predicted transcriptional regulator
MSHSPYNPTICESWTPDRTADKLKAVNILLKKTRRLLDATKVDVANLRDILYVEPVDTDDLIRQLHRAQSLISKMAEKLEIDVE